MDDPGADPGEYCMVVEVQENEHGEIFIVEKNMNVFSTEEVEESVQVDDSVENSIEIVYLPNYDNTSTHTEPIVKREVDLIEDDGGGINIGRNQSKQFRIKCEKPLPFVNCSNKFYSTSNKQIQRTQPDAQYHRSLLKKRAVTPAQSKNGIETQLKSNPNVILKQQSSIIHGQQGKSWSHKVDRRNFEPSAISSVTTIHTKSRYAESDEMITVADIKKEHSVEIVDDLLYPYKCEYCEQAFRGSTSLHIHSSTFHKILPESCIVS